MTEVEGPRERLKDIMLLVLKMEDGSMSYAVVSRSYKRERNSLPLSLQGNTAPLNHFRTSDS